MLTKSDKVLLKKEFALILDKLCSECNFKNGFKLYKIFNKLYEDSIKKENRIDSVSKSFKENKEFKDFGILIDCAMNEDEEWIEKYKELIKKEENK